MERKIINPWTWQDRLGFVQANEISGAKRMLLCAGQVSIGADGTLLHAGDMRGQINQVIDNLETVLKAAGFGLSDVVRMTIYTTQVDEFLAKRGDMTERMTRAGVRYASTLLGVARLARPELLVEIEATAIQ
jgi:enamine deaminase RidA (YjgF/YER057c/UK114 family)